MTDTLTITRPDDWHLHLRDGAALAAVVPDSARQFGRAIVMPNLKPPVTTTAQALAYRERIVAALPAGADFEPLMTLYLTDTLPPAEIERAAEAGIAAVKLYPAGATTNSDAGVTDLRKTFATLEAMQRVGMPLLVHGEVTDPAIDLFDREKAFIDEQLEPLRRDFPGAAHRLRAHHDARRGAVRASRPAPMLGATITAHHLLYNRNAIFTGRHPAALLLPAGAQARGAPPGAGGRGDLGQPALLPRHRQRAACGAPEGACGRLRRLLHRAQRARAVCAGLRRGRRARSPRGLRELQRRRLLPPAAQHAAR